MARAINQNLKGCPGNWAAFSVVAHGAHAPVRELLRCEIIALMKDKPGLKTVCVRLAGLGVDLSSRDAEKLPRRMKVLHWGENQNAHGKRVFVGHKLQAALSAPTYPFKKIPLDFEHNTLPGTPAFKESKEPRQVAGFSGVEVIEGEGVFITMLNWTPAGLENAANYCDLSAGAVRDQDGEVVALPSVGLCRCGAVEGMDFAEFALSVATSAALSAITNATTEEELNWKEMICKALGLDAATTSDEDVATKLANALNKQPDPTALNAAIVEAVKPLRLELDALKAGRKEGSSDDRVTALSVEVGTFRAKMEKRDKQAVLDRARMEGKVVALNADAVAKLSATDLQAHVDALAVTVPLAARTPGVMQPDAVAEGPTDVQRAIALNCGADPDKVFPAKK